MIFKEEVRDLFTVPQGYMLAHCISADFNLGGGIARQFCEHYNMKERLMNGYGTDFSEVGISLQIDNVHNLVTKRYVKDKPTYADLKKALEDMQVEMELDGQKKVAMPRIGCGLDGLDWGIVKAIIKDVFEDTDIEILICVREEDKLSFDKATDYEDYENDKIDDECDCEECAECSHSLTFVDDSNIPTIPTDDELMGIYKAISEEIERRRKNK
mgnify:FL=1